MKFDSDYVVWLIMGTLPSQFDSIRFSYNAQKEQWTIEEMTTILAKEEWDMKVQEQLCADYPRRWGSKEKVSL